MLIIQLTGLSGAGKTTLSRRVKQLLEQQNIGVKIIDGDEYRKTLCKDLGFSKADRCENIRRLGRLAYEFTGTSNVVIIAAINPYEDVRQELKQQYRAKTVWINCPVNELIKRDTKGLYKKALLPELHPDKIYNFTGINDNYDVPVDYDLVINTDLESLEQSSGKFCDFIYQQINGYAPLKKLNFSAGPR
jgi:adenylylsulfate kinase